MSPGPIIVTQVPMASGGVGLPDHRLVSVDEDNYTVEKRTVDARGGDSWTALATASRSSEGGSVLAANLLYRLLVAHAVTRASFGAASGIYRITLIPAVVTSGETEGQPDEAHRYYVLEKQITDATGAASWTSPIRITSSAATPADIKQDALVALLDIATSQPVTVVPD